LLSPVSRSTSAMDKPIDMITFVYDKFVDSAAILL
jgi:hypothetical protein